MQLGRAKVAEYVKHRDTALRSLREAKRALDREIAEYPTPIAGCDAQFTFLLTERRRLAAALDAFGAEVFIPTPRTLTPGAGVESR
jgi:hypothetical protein